MSYSVENAKKIVDILSRVGYPIPLDILTAALGVDILSDMSIQTYLDNAYELGYEDGYAGVEEKTSLVPWLKKEIYGRRHNDPTLYAPRTLKKIEEIYLNGFADGNGDSALETRIEDTKSQLRPVDLEYVKNNNPPAGFDWAMEKRTPEPGDWYLSKNGNGIYCDKTRGNAQTRHILTLKDADYSGR